MGIGIVIGSGTHIVFIDDAWGYHSVQASNISDVGLLLPPHSRNFPHGWVKDAPPLQRVVDIHVNLVTGSDAASLLCIVNGNDFPLYVHTEIGSPKVAETSRYKIELTSLHFRTNTNP